MSIEVTQKEGCVVYLRVPNSFNTLGFRGVQQENRPFLLTFIFHIQETMLKATEIIWYNDLFITFARKRKLEKLVLN